MNYKELMAADIPIASAIISYGEDWKIERVNTEFVSFFLEIFYDFFSRFWRFCIDERDIEVICTDFYTE